MDSSFQLLNTTVKKKTEDETLAERICTIIEDIPDSSFPQSHSVASNTFW